MAICDEKRNKNVAQHVTRLSGIHRRCRAIAIKTPRLWTKVFQSFRPEITDTFIERSFPLNINVSVDGLANPDQFFSHIDKNLHRIGTFHICNLDQWIFWIMAMKVGSFSIKVLPNLSRLIIDRHTVYITYGPNWFPNLIMPNLIYYEGPWITPGAETSWAKTLTHCSIKFLDNDASLLCRGPYISLPSCERLQITFCTDRDVRFDMRLILSEGKTSCLPNLLHLEFELQIDGDADVAYYIMKRYIPTHQLLSLKITVGSRVTDHDCDEIESSLRSFPIDKLCSLQIIRL